jgi:hypothetical protein
VAGIINSIVTKFSTNGAEQTAAATENVTKAQTRLGQTSASNGRQFAAQSQGLGGLVAAYAGAAATSFALQQAFSALQKAAQFDQIIQGTNIFSSQFGQSASSVIGDIKRITQGQLSIVEAATSANIALSAGFNVKQLNDLADVATKASRALGRDLQDSFQRLVRGSAKLEVELLDELGIFTRIEPAVEKYAAKIGKSTTALNDFERRQAFVNSVIDEGQSKFSIIDTSTGTAAQSFSRLAATLTDVALTIGNVVANALAPLADYLNNNIAAAFGAFGVILGLVLSKLNEVSSAGLQNFTKRITEASNAVSNGFAGASAASTKKALGDLSDGVQEYNNTLGQGLGPQRALRNELIESAKAGTISVNQARQLNGILTEQIAKETSKIAVLNAQKVATGATSAQIAIYDAQLTKLTASLNQNTAAAALSASAIAAQGKAAAAAALVTSIFGKAVGFIGSFAIKALSFVNVLLLFSSIASLIGPKLLEVFGLEGIFDKGLEIVTQIGQRFLGLDSISKQFSAGVKGVASSLTEAAFQTQNVKSNLEGAVKTKGLFGEISIKINAETIQKDVAEAISKGFKAAEAAQKEFEASFDGASVGVAVGTRLSRGRVTPGLQALQEEAAALAALNTEEGKRAAGTAAYNAVIQELINSLEEKRGKDGQDFNAIKLLDVQIKTLRDVINLGKEQARIGGFVADITGISAKRAFELFKINEDGVGTLKTINGELSAQFYTQAQIAKLSDKQRPAAKELNDIQAKLGGFANSQLAISEKINKAQLDLNSTGKARSDLLSTEEALQKQIQELIIKGKEVDPIILAGKREQLDTLRQQRLELNKQLDQQESLLRVQDSIRKTFSSQISSLTNITGLVNANGTLATDDLEINRNKLDILEKSVQAGELLRKSIPIEEGETLESTFENTELLVLRTADTAKQALAGSILEAIKKAAELTKEYEKQTIELQKQALSIRLTIQREELQLQQQINAKTSEYNTLVIQNQINSISRAQKANEIAAERIDILRKGREEEFKSQTSGVLSPLFTDKSKREIEIKFKEEELRDLKNALAQQQAAAKQNLDREIALSNEASNRETARIATQERLNEIDNIQKAAEIAFRIEDTKRQEQLFISQSQSIKEQIAAFINHPRELAKVLSQFILDFVEIQKVINPEKNFNNVIQGIQQRENTATAGVALQLQQSQKAVEESTQALSNAYKNLLAAQIEQEKSLGKTAEGQKTIIDLDKKIRDLRSTEAVAAAQAKYNAVVGETGNKLLAATQSLDILKREAERAGNSFIIIAVRIAESITSNLEKGINSLVDAIANGTLTLDNFKKGFKQFIISILSDITKAILNELITKPIKELVFGFTRDLISGLSGSTISETLAKNITPAISSSLTTSLGENITKSISGLKDIGVTPVFVTNVAEFCACANSGSAAGGAGSAAESAASAAIPRATSAAIPRAASAASAAIPRANAAQDNAGRIIYSTPAGPPAPVEVVNATEVGTAVQNAIPQAAAAIAPGATNAAFSSLVPGAAQTATASFISSGTSLVPRGPFGLFGSREVLNPTGPSGFGAMGTTTGAGFNGTVTNGMSAFGGPGYATTFGGGTPIGPGNPGSIAGAPGVTSFGPNAFETSGFKFGNRADAGGVMGESQNLDFAGLQESIDKCEASVTDLTGGFEGFSDTLNLGDTKLTDFSAQSGVANAALVDQSLASQAVAATSTAVQATDVAAQGAKLAENTAVVTATGAVQAFGTALLTATPGGGGGIAGAIVGAVATGASGGYISRLGTGTWARFAAGGGVMMRDRVPSLLEPGEFVMKKSSVDSIGKGSLERMNATGRSSSGPTNIKVQVENQGAPKEAEQRETQVDGETAIVKLILKDLNSNGPIRRSIRGNV